MYRIRHKNATADQPVVSMPRAGTEENPPLLAAASGEFGSHGIKAGATVAQSYITFFKSFVGIAILGLPHAFSLAGYILAPIGLVAIAYASYYCMQQLLECKGRLLETSPAVNPGATEGPRLGAAFDPRLGVSYPDLASACFGSVGRRLAEFCLVSSQMGFCVGYLIFIGANTPGALVALGGPSVTPTSCVLVASFAVTPLVWLRSLEKLAASALLANASILFGIGTVLYFDMDVELQPHGDRGLTAADWAHFPLYYGSAVFSMEGIALVLPIENAMGEPVKFRQVLRNGCIGVTFLLAGFGTFCYVCFGDATEDLITLNLPADNNVVIAMQLFYCVSLFFTYPIMIFPCLQVLENFCGCGFCSRHERETADTSEGASSLAISSSGAWHGWTVEMGTSASAVEEAGDAADSGGRTRQRLVRTLTVAFTTMAAIFVPNFGLVSNTVGAFSCSLMAFVLPALFHLRLFPEQRLSRKCASYAIITVGVVGGALSFEQSVSALARVLSDGNHTSST
jgi:proton-coupled amino acid transporter